jgi:putative transposase
MDFVMDALDNGRRLKCLTIVDDFTKESIDIVVDHSIPGLTRVLDQAITFRGCPRAVRTDQGPEFTGRALDQWAYRHGVELTLIAPGKPTQNAFIESFNGRFRDILPTRRPSRLSKTWLLCSFSVGIRCSLRVYSCIT